VIVANRYPLTQVADAHRQSITGHTTGKIVLIP
jgi:NADPH:quinone reductase-like Zn-dependent oxidoreductase